VITNVSEERAACISVVDPRNISREAESQFAVQEIPHILCNLAVNLMSSLDPATGPIFSEFNPVQAHTHHLF
jgi:hypothetical protein